jgi:hypothetical protein
MSEEKKELGEPQRIMRSPAPERVDRPAVRIKDSVDEADFKAIIDFAKEKGVVEGIDLLGVQLELLLPASYDFDQRHASYHR